MARTKSRTIYTGYVPIGKTGFTSLGGRAVDADTLKVSIYYSKGGLSYWDYRDYPRGYYLSLTPVSLKLFAGFSTESSDMGTGASFFLEMAPRLKGTRLGALAVKYLSIKELLAEKFLDGTLTVFLSDSGVGPASTAARPMRMAPGYGSRLPEADAKEDA